jgi:hypothetical protein
LVLRPLSPRYAAFSVVATYRVIIMWLLSIAASCRLVYCINVAHTRSSGHKGDHWPLCSAGVACPEIASPFISAVAFRFVRLARVNQLLCLYDGPPQGDSIIACNNTWPFARHCNLATSLCFYDQVLVFDFEVHETSIKKFRSATRVCRLPTARLEACGTESLRSAARNFLCMALTMGYDSLTWSFFLDFVSHVFLEYMYWLKRNGDVYVKRIYF